jgi:hypothetical protein
MNYIIPGIAHLMKVEPLTMSRLALEAFITEGGELDVDCTDLQESDDFFKNFALMYVCFSYFVFLADVSLKGLSQ